jgi:hypothetical protein
MKTPLITVNGIGYERVPIKTHVVSEKDTIDSLVKLYVMKQAQQGDILLISERIVAITQGRSFPIASIKPSWWAKTLCKYVSKHPGGIGLRSPWTMELALREAGLFRILFSGFVSAITKPFGIKGLFYRIVGKNINAIDGPCEYTLPPGNTSAKLGPKYPMKVAQQLFEKYKIPVGIVDANDYGVRAMGWSIGLDPHFMEAVFKDNPLGQTNEQTPMAIVRKVVSNQ